MVDLTFAWEWDRPASHRIIWLMLHPLLVHVSFANSSKNPTRLNFPVIVATRSPVKRVVSQALAERLSATAHERCDHRARRWRRYKADEGRPDSSVVRESQPVTGPGFCSDGWRPAPHHASRYRHGNRCPADQAAATSPAVHRSGSSVFRPLPTAPTDQCASASSQRILYSIDLMVAL